jgi:hypothetical protein
MVMYEVHTHLEQVVQAALGIDVKVDKANLYMRNSVK